MKTLTITLLILAIELFALGESLRFAKKSAATNKTKVQKKIAVTIVNLNCTNFYGGSVEVFYEAPYYAHFAIYSKKGCPVDRSPDLYHAEATTGNLTFSLSTKNRVFVANPPNHVFGPKSHVAASYQSKKSYPPFQCVSNEYASWIAYSSWDNQYAKIFSFYDSSCKYTVKTQERITADNTTSTYLLNESYYNFKVNDDICYTSFGNVSGSFKLMATNNELQAVLIAYEDDRCEKPNQVQLVDTDAVNDIFPVPIWIIASRQKQVFLTVCDSDSDVISETQLFECKNYRTAYESIRSFMIIAKSRDTSASLVFFSDPDCNSLYDIANVTSGPSYHSFSYRKIDSIEMKPRNPLIIDGVPVYNVDPSVCQILPRVGSVRFLPTYYANETAAILYNTYFCESVRQIKVLEIQEGIEMRLRESKIRVNIPATSGEFSKIFYNGCKDISPVQLFVCVNYLENNVAKSYMFIAKPGADFAEKYIFSNRDCIHNSHVEKIESFSTNAVPYCYKPSNKTVAPSPRQISFYNLDGKTCYKTADWMTAFKVGPTQDKDRGAVMVYEDMDCEHLLRIDFINTTVINYIGANGYTVHDSVHSNNFLDIYNRSCRFESDIKLFTCVQKVDRRFLDEMSRSHMLIAAPNSNYAEKVDYDGDYCTGTILRARYVGKWKEFGLDYCYLRKAWIILS